MAETAVNKRSATIDRVDVKEKSLMGLPGWEVRDHAVQLPPGYTLREDDHLVYLCKNSHVVIVLSALIVTPELLQAVVNTVRTWSDPIPHAP
jgi:hypothetical protein